MPSHYQAAAQVAKLEADRKASMEKVAAQIIALRRPGIVAAAITRTD
jgi:hypothetical protein